MFKKGKKLVLTYGEGRELRDTEAVVVNEKPLRIEIGAGQARAIHGVSGPDHIINLCDPDQVEVLSAMLIDKVVDERTLQVRTMGTRELRRFVRIVTWVELSHEELTPEEQAIGLDAFVQPELGQPLPELSDLQIKTLADTDAASEAVVYMLKAIQAMDRKIEALAGLTRQLIERTYKVQMSRQRVNISGSGVLFECGTAYEVGTVLNLRIRLSQMRHREIVAHGRVVRVDELQSLDGSRGFGIACDFVKIKESDRESIITFTVQKQREALRRMRIQGDGF